MRVLIAFALLATVGIAQAETPPAVKRAPATEVAQPKSFEVKSFEPKALEFTTPSLEIKTREMADSDLDRKLAGKKSKSAGGEAALMRAPSKSAIIEAAEQANAAQAAAASATAPVTSAPDSNGTR